VVPSATRAVRQGTLRETDLNGDGRTDLVFDQDVFLGRSRIEDDAGKTIPVLPDPIATCTPRPPDHGITDGRCTNMGELAAVGDLDADGFDDLLAYEAPRCLFVFRGGKDIPSPWRASARLCPRDLQLTRNARIIRLGDVNSDGFEDVGLPVRGGLGIFLGQAGSLSEQPSAVLPSYDEWAAGGDVDGDGFDDAAALSADGAIALFKGGPNGLSTNPDAQLRLPHPPTLDGDERVIDPRMRLIDFDGDGLADIVGATLGSSPRTSPDIWMVPGSQIFTAHGPTYIRRWPLKNEHEPGFRWDAVVGPGTSSSAVMLIADRGQDARELVPVSFRARAGFSFPSKVDRIPDITTYSRDLLAVGDVNGDAFEDLLVIVTEDIDGSRNAELLLGSAQGISANQGYYAWPYDGDRTEGSPVRVLSKLDVTRAH